MSELDEELENLDDAGDDSGDDSADGESKPDKTPKSSDKRVSDLQSMADKETARANKAEKRIAALEAALKGPSTDGGQENPNRASNASTDPLVLEMAQMFAYQQHPRLAEFGVEMSDIVGSTPSEVAKNAAALMARFEKVETIARNKVLAEQGITPDLSADAPTDRKSRDFSAMPKEEFEKIVERALRGERV